MKTRTVLFAIVLLLCVGSIFPLVKSSSIPKAIPRATTQEATVTPTKTQLPFTACLPSAYTIATPFVYTSQGHVEETLGKKLQDMGAYCTGETLLDKKGQKIVFFSKTCQGNAPAYSGQKVTPDTLQLEELQQKYDVVVIPCNPSTD